MRTQHRYNYIIDVFYRERQLCELFNSENNGFDTNFNINSSEATIFIVILKTGTVKTGKKI